MKHLFLTRIAALALLILPLSLAAQDQALTFDHRVAGDRVMTIEMGPVLPLFTQDFSGNVTASHLTPGGTLALDVDFYLNDTFRLGGGIKGLAAFGPNGNTLFMVPLSFRATWELKTFPWSFPIGVATGMSFISYRQQTNMDFFITPLAGAYWNWNPSWSFGADLGYWFVVEPYFGNPIPVSDSRMAHFIDLTLGAVYHF